MALRIPKELAFAETIQEVETERIGNALGVCPLEEETRDVMNGKTGTTTVVF
jgi:virulence-associated protein VagC